MKYDEESIILEEDDGFQLVDQQRDFVPGSVLLRNVADAISRSRRMIMLLSRLLLPSATSLRQGNVFTSVCHSVHRGCLGGHPPRADTSLGRQPPGQTHRVDTPLGRQPPGQTPLPGQTLLAQQTATAADGTHPTGMHSCLMLILAALGTMFSIPRSFTAENGQNKRLVPPSLGLAPPVWEILDPPL